MWLPFHDKLLDKSCGERDLVHCKVILTMARSNGTLRFGGRFAFAKRVGRRSPAIPNLSA